MIDLLSVKKAIIEDVKVETPEVKTFVIKVEEPFRFKSGQFIMISMLGVGESPFAVSSSPQNPMSIEVTIQKTGMNTTAIHELSAGDAVWYRGPYGNGFPVEEWGSKNRIVIAGGIGLAPIRSLLYDMIDNRQNSEDILLLYGIRSYDKAIYKKELSDLDKKINVQIISEYPEEGSDRRVGFVTQLIEQQEIDPSNSIAVMCGPHRMIEACVNSLEKKGLVREQMYVSLEMKMKCGVGICGRCNIDHRHICKDGPVFRVDEINL